MKNSELYKYMIISQIKRIILFFLIGTLNYSLLSQENIYDKSERYLVFDSVSNLFEISDDNLILECFYLYNIRENESSKPIHIAINDLIGVKKFSIESASSNYENRRRCKLILGKNNYINTFRMVIYNMGVNYIIYDGEKKSVEEFLELLKS